MVKTLIDSALHDLSVAIYLHQGEKWLHACLSAKSAGEKFASSILINRGVIQSEVLSISRRYTQVNDQISSLGLYDFSESDHHHANVMQRMLSNQQLDFSTAQAPHHLFDSIDSAASIKWAANYFDIAVKITGMISLDQREPIKSSLSDINL